MKTTNGIIVFIAVLIVSVALYSFSRNRVNDYRTDYAYILHAAAPPMPPLVIEALAGEFKGIVADYLFLEAASFNGSIQSFDATSDDWDAVARLLEQSNTLDPYFRSTYALAQGTLPWRAKKYDETLTILERSRQHLLWDWLPRFYMGFDYFFFLKDNSTASKYLMEASKVAGPANSTGLATWASRLASKAGQTSAGIDFLIAMYETTEDEENRATLKQRIEALKGVLILQTAVDQFREQFGRLPSTLNELVEHSIIASLPVNPYHSPYLLKDGVVDF